MNVAKGVFHLLTLRGFSCAGQRREVMSTGGSAGLALATVFDDRL